MRAAILLLLTLGLTFLSDAASCRRKNSQSDKESVERPDKPPPQEGDPFAKVPRISVEELAQGMKDGSAVAVDIREAEDYAKEHIKGAVSIPLEEIRERGPKELPQGKLIVTYCA